MYRYFLKTVYKSKSKSPSPFAFAISSISTCVFLTILTSCITPFDHALCALPDFSYPDSAYQPRQPYHHPGTSFHFPSFHLCLSSKIASFEAIRVIEKHPTPKEAEACSACSTQTSASFTAQYPDYAKRFFPTPIPRVWQPFTVRLYIVEL